MREFAVVVLSGVPLPSRGEVFDRVRCPYPPHLRPNEVHLNKYQPECVDLDGIAANLRPGYR